MSVAVNSTTATRAAQVFLSFDPAKLRANSVSEGSYYKSWASNNGASTLVFPSGTIDNTAGTVGDFGDSVMGTVAGGATGSGAFVTYSFTALANGVSNLYLSDVVVADANGHSISGVVVNNGQVTVGTGQGPVRTTLAPSPAPPPTQYLDVADPIPQWDVNGDHTDNVSDIATIGQHWLQTGPPGWISADVNHDGAVNVNDVVIVGQSWLASWYTYNRTLYPGYAHGWYITNINSTALQQLGQNDANYYTSVPLLEAMTILDFGQPTLQGAYGTDYFLGPQGTYMSDYQIETAAEQYASAWYQIAPSTVHLKLVIGTNNFNECINSPGCSNNLAGEQWGNVVNDVENYLYNNGYAWQITAWAGDDIENWDCYSPTVDFVNGFNGNDPSGARFIDFGTAWLNSCWTPSNVGYVAYGATHDYPLPEIYTLPALQSWQAEMSAYPGMYFEGVLSSCRSSDPITSCPDSGFYTPYQAWSNFWPNVTSQGTLYYATNQRFQ